MGDTSISAEILFKTFCSEEQVLNYLTEFSAGLCAKNNVSKNDMFVFKEFLHFIEKTKLLHMEFQNETDIKIDSNCPTIFLGELFNRLENILNNLYSHDLLQFFAENPIDEVASHHCTIEILCEVIPILLKLLIDRIKHKNMINTLIEELCRYIKLKNKFENNLDISMPDECFQSTIFLKLLSDVIYCIPEVDSKSYIADENLYTVLNILPSFDDKSLNYFAVHIFPKMMLIADEQAKRNISNTMWKIICRNFDCYLENKTIDRKSCPYTVLCCLVQSMFVMSKDEIYYPIHQEAKFWEIIQFGFSDNHPFTRKRSLHIFKQFHFWAQSIKLKEIVINKSSPPIYSVRSASFDFSLIWDDIILLLEVLEENQVHVIKPLMSKFEKIIKLVEIDTGAADYTLHPSWVVFVAKRMLQHDSSYIVKWTLLHCLNLKLQNCSIHQHSSFQTFLKIILQAVNNQVLYTRSEEETEYSLSLTQEKICTFFKNCILALRSVNEEEMFLKSSLEIIAHQSWCGVALVYVTCALSQLDDCQAWNQPNILLIRKIILESHRNQEPMLRGAIQCYMLESCFKFLDWNSITLTDLTELLSVFKSKECISRHSVQWTNCVSKLKAVFTMNSKEITLDKAKEFCHEWVTKVQEKQDLENPNAFCAFDTSEMEKFSRMLLFLADAGVICPDPCSCDSTAECLHWATLLEPITSVIHSAQRRPYMHKWKFLNSLQFYTALFQLCNSEGSEDLHRKNLITCLGDLTPVVPFLIQYIFTELCDFEDIVKLNILFDAFHVLSNEEELQCHFFRIIPACFSHFMRILERNSTRNSMFFQLWKGLGWINEFYPRLLSVQSDTFIHTQLHLILNKIIEVDIFESSSCKPNFFNDASLKEQWLKITNESICDVWKVMSYGLQNLNFNEELIKCIAQRALRALDKSSPQTITSIMSCIRLLLQRLTQQNSDFISDIFEHCWKACLELRRNETFRPALSVLITAIFQKEMMYEKFSCVLNEYVEKLMNLSENSVGIFNFVMEHLCSNFTLKDIKRSEFNCFTIFSYALTFGPIHRRDQKTIEEAIFFVEEQGEALSVNKLLFGTHKPDPMVRVIAVNFLLQNLSTDSHEDEEFVLQLIESLFDVDLKASQCRSSRFSNSYSHRLKNRTWQAILVLHSYVSSEEGCEHLLRKVTDFLVMENQQPSISYLQEWIVIKILVSKPNLFELFMSFAHTCAEKRLGCASSFLAILIHLIKMDVINSESLVLQCLPFVFQFCMSQNFNVRLHAQLALKFIWNLCVNKGFSNVLIKYDFIEKLLIKPEDSASKQGNFGKNLIKLSRDFYFAAFDPINHYTIETIYKELLRLSNLIYDEWIHPSMFAKNNMSENSSCIPYFNNNDKLAMSNPTMWSSKPSTETDPSQLCTVYDFQKKVTPWKDMLINCENMDEDMKSKRKADAKEGLIVVASLIDRLPNLGGLCRTCEVFGVQEYVIGSLKYTEDKHFQNLAVTADKWVQIKEVKPHDLKNYLSAIKEQGYTIIAAEQTENSQLLCDYVFPKKSVLLLGHEKQGVPVELIQMMDMCIEIPQQGIVRSLNVHVSGAILIWEYARQHLKCM